MSIPLVLIVAAPLLLHAATLVVVLRVAPRRAAPGHCAACGYDVAGLPSGGRCPECGVTGAQRRAFGWRDRVSVRGLLATPVVITALALSPLLLLIPARHPDLTLMGEDAPLIWGSVGLAVGSVLVAWILTRWLSPVAVLTLKLPVWLTHAGGIALYQFGLWVGDTDGWALTVLAVWGTPVTAAGVGLLALPFGVVVERRVRRTPSAA